MNSKVIRSLGVALGLAVAGCGGHNDNNFKTVYSERKDGQPIHVSVYGEVRGKATNITGYTVQVGENNDMFFSAYRHEGDVNPDRNHNGIPDPSTIDYREPGTERHIRVNFGNTSGLPADSISFVAGDGDLPDVPLTQLRDRAEELVRLGLKSGTPVQK